MIIDGQELFLTEEADNELCGEKYQAIIRYALETCDAFMFVCCYYYNSGIYKREVKPFVKELSPLSIKRRQNSDWPGQRMLWEEVSRRYQYSIRFYRSDFSAYDLLIRPDGFYKWGYPHYPEDITFFRHGYPWLITISHEWDFWIRNPTKEDRLFFQRLFGRENITIKNYKIDENKRFYEKGISDESRCLPGDAMWKGVPNG